MAKKVQEQTKNFLQLFQAERTFIIFSIIYFPLTIVLINQGAVEELLLAVYGLFLLGVGILLLVRFTLRFIQMLQEKEVDMSKLFTNYLLDALLPLLMFKVIAYVSWRILPEQHEGMLCELKRLVIDLFKLFQIQDTLSLLIAGSFIIFLALAIYKLVRGIK